MEFDYAKLRQVRQQKGLTIKELADACDVSPSLISQVERGKVTPTLTVFWRICQALDIPMHYFLDIIAPKAWSSASISEKSSNSRTLTSNTNCSVRTCRGRLSSCSWKLSPALRMIQKVW
ncbi:hypothetical protein ALPO108162_05290 [Alicyclobacillus pomorum]